MKTTSNPLWEPIYDPNMYKTTTQELQENVLYKPVKNTNVKKRQVNFASYRFRQIQYLTDVKLHNVNMVSTYQREYKFFFTDIKKPKELPDEKPLFYGKAYNVFEYRPTVNSKFMDDLIVRPSPERVRKDCLRQLKNKSQLFQEETPPNKCETRSAIDNNENIDNTENNKDIGQNEVTNLCNNIDDTAEKKEIEETAEKSENEINIKIEIDENNLNRRRKMDNTTHLC